MKCFYHQELDAIGICKKCQKGLCSECATDLEHGIACKGKHEKEAGEIEALISRNIKAVPLQAASVSVTNFQYLFMGAIFAGYGFYQNNLFLILFGGAVVAYWLYLRVYNLNLFKKIDGKSET